MPRKLNPTRRLNLIHDQAIEVYRDGPDIRLVMSCLAPGNHGETLRLTLPASLVAPVVAAIREVPYAPRPSQAWTWKCISMKQASEFRAELAPGLTFVPFFPDQLSADRQNGFLVLTFAGLELTIGGLRLANAFADALASGLEGGGG